MGEFTSSFVDSDHHLTLFSSTPLWNFKNIRPAWEYEKWLQENRPENFDPEKIQERKDAYFTPNGTSRIQSEGSSSSLVLFLNRWGLY